MYKIMNNSLIICDWLILNKACAFFNMSRQKRQKNIKLLLFIWLYLFFCTYNLYINYHS